MYRGWVKIHRKLWDNPVITQDPDYLAVWIWLLTNASHKRHDVYWGGRRFTLHPGQLITGRKIIAKITKVNDQKVYRILKTLKSEQQIEQQTTRQGSLITIVNWNEYQQSEQQIEQPMNNDRTTYEQPMNTIQECIENKKMINNDLLSNEAKNKWEDLRRRVKK